MDKLDKLTAEDLINFGVNPSNLKEQSTQGLPYNTSGIAGLKLYNANELLGSNIRGFVVAPNAVAKTEANRGRTQALFKAPNAGADVVGHEAEHMLARNAFGHPSMVNEKFDELIGDKSARTRLAFVKQVVEAAPYLKQKYGIENAYFSPNILEQGPVGFYEQLASLAGYEAANNIDLTKDPFLRKTLFSSPAVREAYNAITGLRQTRLDTKDIPPYTRIPEETPSKAGLKEQIGKLLKFANGGFVPNAGATKLI